MQCSLWELRTRALEDEAHKPNGEDGNLWNRTGPRDMVVHRLLYASTLLNDRVEILSLLPGLRASVRQSQTSYCKN